MKNELIEEHYRRNYGRLVKRTINRVPNRTKFLAEECVQEAYTRALKYFNTFNPKKDIFEKWFEGILRNCINSCRTEEKDRGVNKDVDNIGEDIVPYMRERWKGMYYIHQLPEGSHKKVIELFIIYGYKSKDIAEYTGLTHTNVRQIIHRFRNNI